MILSWLDWLGSWVTGDCFQAVGDWWDGRKCGIVWCVAVTVQHSSSPVPVVIQARAVSFNCLSTVLNTCCTPWSEASHLDKCCCNEGPDV